MRAIISTLMIVSTAAFAATDFDRRIKQGRDFYSAYEIDAAESAYAQACVADAAKGVSLQEYALQESALQESALCEHEFGTIAEARGKPDEALRHYLNSLAGWEKSGSPHITQRITTLTNLGGLYRRLHRLDDAEKTLSQAFELAKPLATPDPELYAIVLSRLGSLYGDLEQPDRARGMLNEAMTGLRALKKPNQPELAYAYSALGMVELGAGRYKDGEAALRKSLDFANASLGENHPETAGYATDLALALLVQGENNRAETILKRARFVLESRLGPDSIELVAVLGELTSVETALGKFGLAEDYGEKTLALLKRHVPAGSPEIALAQIHLGTLYLREHKIAEAEKVLPPAVEAERRFLKEGRTLGYGVRNLAALRVQQQAWTEAESLYREAIGLYEITLGTAHPDLAPVLHEYADVLKHQRAPKAKVRDIETRARTIANPSASRG